MQQRHRQTDDRLYIYLRRHKANVT